MLEATQDILLTPLDFLPLRSNDNIIQANALRCDWNDLLPANECNFIIGNPPFLGYSNQSKSQKEDMLAIWRDGEGESIKQAGKLDYVSAWYYKASEYISGQLTRCAFVSTNSIVQGEQVQPIWETLQKLFGIHIDFAWSTFVWNSEAFEKAHVHVVVIGFSSMDAPYKMLFDLDGVRTVDNINGYLAAAPSVFVSKEKSPLSDVPKMTTGNRPADGGHLIIEESDYESFVQEDPRAVNYIRPLLGSLEFINNKPRYCLWLVGVSEEEIDEMPLVRERVMLCQKDRANSPDAGRRKLASTPHLFREQASSASPYLVVPKVSSERRQYVPIGYLQPEVIPTDLLFVVWDGGPYEFGILTSQFHNAWMRTVAGRMKSDYRYSQDLVYNTFVWPNPTPEQKGAVEQAAQAVLDVRAAHPGKSLAELYDPDKMPPDLLAAHKALDNAVEDAYGVDFDGDEEKIVAHLFRLYEKIQLAVKSSNYADLVSLNF